MHALTAAIAALLRPAPTVASAAVMLTVAGVTLAVLSATAATLPAARLPAGRGRRLVGAFFIGIGVPAALRLLSAAAIGASAGWAPPGGLS